MSILGEQQYSIADNGGGQNRCLNGLLPRQRKPERLIGSELMSQSVELLHKREKISYAPVVGDLAVSHAHHVNGFELNSAMRRSNSEEWAIVCTVIGFVGRHPVAIGQLPMDLRAKVGEGVTNIAVQFPDARFIGCHVRLRGVVHEIVREKVFEEIEVAFALDLFRI